MLRAAVILLVLIIVGSFSSSAQESVTAGDVRTAYEEFEYARVVELSARALAAPDSLSRPDRIAISTLRAVAQYNLGDEDSARTTVLRILALDPAFTLDPVHYSPKIVEFVEQIRKTYAPPRPLSMQPNAAARDSLPLIQPLTGSPSNGALAKSMVLPGWGHLSNGESTTGWLITAAAAAAMASSVYFIVRTNRLERAYLLETDRNRIDARYDDYNAAYKTRNILLGSYAAIWTAAQVDLLFFSHTTLSASLAANEGSLASRTFIPLLRAKIDL